MPSGENAVVENEMSALSDAGHQVSAYVRDSDELAEMSFTRKVGLTASPIHSRSAVADIELLISRERPDVMHLHNPYPLISMAVVRAANRKGVPVVHTVHNHRHTCMKGTYQRDGHECRDCLVAGRPWPGVRHACYRESRTQSAVMAAAILHNRGAYALIDRFIALTSDIAESLCASGFHPSRISVKPNSVPDPGPPKPLGNGFAYIGRLSQEKGVLALLQAWLRSPEGTFGTLRIAGDGPERIAVERAAAGRKDIEVHGQVDPAGVRRLLDKSAVVVVPSLWPEAFPLVLLEALAAGRPLLVTNEGGLPQVVDDDIGCVVRPNVEGIASGIASLAARRKDLLLKSHNARDRYESTYHPQSVTKALIDIYAQVIAAAV